MAFKYVPPTVEQITKRINSGGATGYDNFLKADFETFTPAKGDNWIRILPPTWENPEHWAIFIFAHYGLGPDRGSALCLEKMGKGPCPVCEYRKKMVGKIDDDELKELKWRAQSLAWILDRDNENEGPKLWAMSVGKCDEPITKLAIDRESGELVDFRHPYDGYDVYFTRTGEGLKTQYSGFTLARRMSSVKDKWLDFIADHPLPDTLLWRSYEEVQALFEGTTSRKNEDERKRDREEPRGRSGRDDRDERARYEDDRPEPRGRAARGDDDDRGGRGRVRDEEPRGRAREREEEPPRRSRDEAEEPPRRERARDDEPPARERERPTEDAPRRSREQLDDAPSTSGRSRADELRERFSNKDK